VAEQELNNTDLEGAPEGKTNLGDEILEMLGQRTKNPGEAFVLLQQLSVFLWAQYKIDWSDVQGHKVADTRKQRYLDFLSGLIDQTPTDAPPPPIPDEG
jgi:hypothetical protein